MNCIPPNHLLEVTAQVEALRVSLQALLGKEVVVSVELSEQVAPDELVRQYILNTFNITWNDLTSASRKENVVDARRCYCYLMRHCVRAKFTELADQLNRDHSSIIHAIMRASDLLRVEDRRITAAIKGFIALHGEYFSL